MRFSPGCGCGVAAYWECCNGQLPLVLYLSLTAGSFSNFTYPSGGLPLVGAPGGSNHVGILTNEGGDLVTFTLVGCVANPTVTNAKARLIIRCNSEPLSVFGDNMIVAPGQSCRPVSGTWSFDFDTAPAGVCDGLISGVKTFVLSE